MRSLKTAPSGERLFYPSGSDEVPFFWPRPAPYIIPDAETEQRLFTKRLWMYRLQSAVMSFGGAVLGFQIGKNSLWNSLWFIVYLIAIVVVVNVAGWLIFRSDLRGLARAPAHAPGRLSLSAACRKSAANHGWANLLFRFLFCLASGALGVWLLTLGLGGNVVIGLFAVTVFGSFAVIFGCSLYLKLTDYRHRSMPTHGRGPD